jgi:glycosyltransferase involved in cell wall biosynthesis
MNEQMRAKIAKLRQIRWDRFFFKEALEFLEQADDPLVLEIGGIRDARPIAARADGHSTVHWADSGHRVICVDLSSEVLDITRLLIGGAANVELCQADGIDFLKALEQPISLLYLDGPDPKDGGPEFALRCFQAANMADRSAILIDDCDIEPGKGDLVIPAALESGFRVTKRDRQVLLVKGDDTVRSVAKRARVGLIGYRNNSGLGELNRQIATYLDLSQWLVIRHKCRETAPEFPDVPSRIYDQSNSSAQKFVASADVILFCEVPFDARLLKIAKAQGKRAVCVPMLEWTPESRREWVPLVDLFICPTRQCYDALKQEGLPCEHFPWPVDLKRFQWRERNRCDRFLFVNGWGGWKGRKGASVVCRSKTLWPAMPLVVRSQARVSSWPDGIEFLPPAPTNTFLYDRADELLAPHTVDGLGLEPMEAMACGMPVITPDAPPWNENPAVSRIATKVTKMKIKRVVDWHECLPESLIESCTSLLGADISVASHEARQWAEKRSWDRLANDFKKLVTG